MSIKPLSYIQYFGRSITFIAAIIAGQQLGLAHKLLALEPQLMIKDSRSIAYLIIAVIVGTGLFYISIGDIWNKITPVQDRSTFIETEIIYLLNLAFGVTFISLIAFSVDFTHLPALFGWCFLSSLPSMGVGYLTARIYRRTILLANPDLMPDNLIPAAPLSKDPYFWINRFAFLFGAIAFHLFMAISILATIWVKTGILSGSLHVILTCGTGSLILFSLFGSLMLTIGQWSLARLGIQSQSARINDGLGLFTGIMIFTSFCAALALLPILFNDPSAVLDVGDHGVAYIIIGFCAAGAGTVFGFTRHHQPISRIFA